VRLDPQGEEAQDVLVDAHLALHLRHGRVGGVDVEQREVRLAVLLDAVGERLDAPVLGLADGAAVRLDDALELLDQGLDLLCRNILACQEDVLVESHWVAFPFNRRRPGAEPFEPCRQGPSALFEGGDTGRRGRSPCRPHRGIPSRRQDAAVRSAPGRSEREAGPLRDFWGEGKGGLRRGDEGRIRRRLRWQGSCGAADMDKPLSLPSLTFPSRTTPWLDGATSAKSGARGRGVGRVPGRGLARLEKCVTWHPL